MSEFCDVIAIIVPRTFRKKKLQNRLNRQFHLEFEEILDLESFVFEDKVSAVPTVFQIWVRKPHKRELHSIPMASEDFIFTTKDKADFAIQRVGDRAGQIRLKDTMLAFSPSSHLFIKMNNPEVLDVFERIDFDAVKFDTAGNPSVSPGEIIELYENHKTDHRK